MIEKISVLIRISSILGQVYDHFCFAVVDAYYLIFLQIRRLDDRQSNKKKERVFQGTFLSKH